MVYLQPLVAKKTWERRDSPMYWTSDSFDSDSKLITNPTCSVLVIIVVTEWLMLTESLEIKENAMNLKRIYVGFIIYFKTVLLNLCHFGTWKENTMYMKYPDKQPTVSSDLLRSRAHSRSQLTANGSQDHLEHLWSTLLACCPATGRSSVLKVVKETVQLLVVLWPQLC